MTNEEHARNAVTDLVAAISPGGFMQGFVVIVNLIDAEGEQQLYSFEAEGQELWTTMGYVDACHTELQSRLIAGRVNAADDDQDEDP